MADIRPFRAWRPRPDIADRVAALPYDVYDRAEARAEVEREPLSFLGIDRPETQFPKEYDMYAPEVYDKARDLLWSRIDSGDFVRDEAPCYYIYDQCFMGRSQTGIVAVSSVDDYLSGVIKKHENTLEAKEQDRIRHVDTCDMQTGPIFLCYRRDEELGRVIQGVMDGSAPLYDFETPQGVRSRVWRIDAERDVAAVNGAFGRMDAVYIADGHHRCASAVKVALKRRAEAHTDVTGAPYDYFLSVLFPDDQLMIMDYNRVVRDLRGRSAEEFIAELGERFEVIEEKEAVHPAAKGEFGLYLSGRWYRLRVGEKLLSDDAVESLDVSILQNVVLSPMLGIDDPKKDPRIGFVGGIRGLEELERLCDDEGWAAAFSMYPTDIHELFRVADEGRLMPPKSTWFEPKLLSGLFLHQLT